MTWDMLSQNGSSCAIYTYDLVFSEDLRMLLSGIKMTEEPVGFPLNNPYENIINELCFYDILGWLITLGYLVAEKKGMPFVLILNNSIN